MTLLLEVKDKVKWADYFGNGPHYGYLVGWGIQNNSTSALVREVREYAEGEIEPYIQNIELSSVELYDWELTAGRF